MLYHSHIISLANTLEVQILLIGICSDYQNKNCAALKSIVFTCKINYRRKYITNQSTSKLDKKYML